MSSPDVRVRGLVASGVLALALALTPASPGRAAPGATTPGAATTPTPAPPVPTASFPLTPKRMLGLIRATFRSHRPPPPFESYTIQREQNTEQGFHDPVESYTEHVWVRNLDRAAFSRKVERGSYRDDPVFERPAFNEPRDPGPPTADIFEPAPKTSHPLSFVPTPEPTNSAAPLEVLAKVQTLIELDYDVQSAVVEKDELHLTLEPLRDPNRNRLRELFVDKNTYELHRVVATDLLFVDSNETYGVEFTITFAQLDGLPVVTDIHGIVGDGYNGDGKIVDYHFRDIKFPATLPDWYFGDPKQWGAHRADWPS